MNKYEVFLKYFAELQENFNSTPPEEVSVVLQILKNQSLSEKAKSLITEAGMKILEYMQNTDARMVTASDIAQGMEVSSRKVTGAIRKLAADNFVEKFGQSPVKYSLTEQGKNFNIEEYKESLKNEKVYD